MRTMLCATLLAFAIGSVGTVHVHAAGEKKLPFAITPVFPTNQDKEIRGYYKLDFEPGKKQTVTIRIRNDKDGELTLFAGSLNALTIANGGIDYTEKIKNDSSSLLDEKYAIKPLIKVPETVVLKKGETKEIKVEITSPNISEGTALGGIDFMEKDASDPTQVGSEGGVSFNIQNKVDFKLAVQLDYTKNIETNVKLGDATIKSLPSGPQLYMRMVNNAAKIEKNIEGTYEVFDEKGASIFTGKLSGMDMAPKTDVNYPIAWTGKTIGEGKYTIKMTITKDGKQLDSAEKQFEITNETIINIPKPDSSNPVVVGNEDDSNMKQYLIFGGLVVVALALGILLGRRRKKEKDPEKELEKETKEEPKNEG